jgi:hypothetical protein
MSHKRRGNWNVLLAHIALVYIAIKSLATRKPQFLTPAIMMINFLINRYENDIIYLAKKIRMFFRRTDYG